MVQDVATLQGGSKVVEPMFEPKYHANSSLRNCGFLLGSMIIVINLIIKKNVFLPLTFPLFYFKPVSSDGAGASGVQPNQTKRPIVADESDSDSDSAAKHF